MRASRLQVLLRHALGQAADEAEDLPVVVPQPALWVEVRRGQARDVAVALGVGERGRALDVGVRGAGRRRGRPRGGALEALLQHQLAQAAGGLGEVGAARASRAPSRRGRRRRGARGREAVLVDGGRGRGGAAVAVLGRRDRRGLFAGGVAQDGLDVLVAPLVRPPVGVAEGLGDRVDVELVDERLVRQLRFCWCGHRVKGKLVDAPPRIGMDTVVLTIAVYPNEGSFVIQKIQMKNPIRSSGK